MSEVLENQRSDDLSVVEEPAVAPVERRSFLALVIGMISTGIAGLLGVTVGRYVIEPSLAGSAGEQWVDAGMLAEIPEGAAVRRKVAVSREIGWGKQVVEEAVWIRRNNDKVEVFSSVCPHLGCTINHTSEGFACPCHQSRWNEQGQKTGGPTPRDMDRFESRIEDGVLRVRHQSFKQGSPEKEAV